MFFTRQWEHHDQEGPEIVDFLQSRRHIQTKQIESEIALTMKSEGLYESDFDLFDVQLSSLQKLVGFIRGSLALAVSVANNQEASPDAIEIQFVDSWYHITNDGGFHDAHVHHGCSWCGIYYLQIGSSGKGDGKSAPNGGSRFYCPFGLGGAYRDYGNKYLKTTVDTPMSDGLLLLFPSYLLHSGLSYRGKEDRIVIAFNARAFLKS